MVTTLHLWHTKIITEMKTTIFGLLLLAAFFSASLTLSNQTTAITGANHLVFHANKEAIGQGSPGHIYITFTKNNSDLGTYGFYPMDAYKKAEFLAGVEVAGRLEDDVGQSPTHSFHVNVTDVNFERAWQIKQEWANTSRGYIGGKQDCITFALAVAKAANLNVSPRSTLGTFPLEILKSLESKN